MRRSGALTAVVVLAAVALVVKTAGVATGYVREHAAGLAVGAVVVLLLGAGMFVMRQTALARAREHEDQLARYIEDTDGMTGTEFEHWCAALLRASGLSRVVVSGRSGDLGADIVGYTDDGLKVVVQCKRFTHSVGDPLIQQFNGTVWQIHQADVALFLTTGRPTRSAWELAERVGITLVDRRGLAEWAAGGPPPVPELAPVRVAEPPVT